MTKLTKVERIVIPADPSNLSSREAMEKYIIERVRECLTKGIPIFIDIIYEERPL